MKAKARPKANRSDAKRGQRAGSRQHTDARPRRTTSKDAGVTSGSVAGADPKTGPRTGRHAHYKTVRGQEVAEPLFYGRHAVMAALGNPKRRIKAVHADTRGLSWLQAQTMSVHKDTPLTAPSPVIDLLQAKGLPHQGIAVEVAPLPAPAIEDMLSPAPNTLILAVDQVTDPQNIGACMRTAAAFGAAAFMTQDRNSPGESGALAKAASGTTETLPWLRVTNLAQALQRLKDAGYWTVGFAGDGDTRFTPTDPALQALTGQPTVLVMGSEGKGLRPLVRKHCDVTARIPIAPNVESLNVSNAAAIALYARRLLDG